MLDAARRRAEAAVVQPPNAPALLAQVGRTRIPGARTPHGGSAAIVLQYRDMPVSTPKAEISDAPARAAREGHRLILEHLGIEKPSNDALLEVAREALGQARLSQCVASLAAGPVDRGVYAMASLAGLVVATRALGVAWWTLPRQNFSAAGEWTTCPRPDEVLATCVDETGRSHTSVLERLCLWGADDVADLIWGRPFDFVDLNSIDPIDRIVLPAGARVGDCLVTSFDPGSRVDLVVVERGRVLGSELDMSTVRHSPPSETWWGWATVMEARPSGPLTMGVEDDPGL